MRRLVFLAATGGAVESWHSLWAIAGAAPVPAMAVGSMLVTFVALRGAVSLMGRVVARRTAVTDGEVDEVARWFDEHKINSPRVGAPFNDLGRLDTH